MTAVHVGPQGSDIGPGGAFFHKGDRAIGLLQARVQRSHLFDGLCVSGKRLARFGAYGQAVNRRIALGIKCGHDRGSGCGPDLSNYCSIQAEFRYLSEPRPELSALGYCAHETLEGRESVAAVLLLKLAVCLGDFLLKVRVSFAEVGTVVRNELGTGEVLGAKTGTAF